MKCHRAHPHYMKFYMREYRARPIAGKCRCGQPAARWYSGSRCCLACIRAAHKRPMKGEQ